MHVEKNSKGNKIILVLFMLVLIALLVFLIITLVNSNKTVKSETITCKLEEDDVAELTSEVSIKYQDDKVNSLTFNYLYIYSDNEYLLSLKYQDEKATIDTLKNLKGVNATIEYDPNATLLEIKGSVDYSKIDKIADVEKPYSVFARPDLTKHLVTEYLKEEGYTCE